MSDNASRTSSSLNGFITAVINFITRLLEVVFGRKYDARLKGSTYIDLSAVLDVGAGITFTPHVGRQNVENVPDASYTDYSLTFNKEFSGAVLGLSLVTTDASERFYVPGPAANSKQFLGKSGVVLSAKYNF
ncbi:MAG: hypothetical protein EB017_14110 [Betaproteobacteria bacterium]|nr:hypothetical protein [Betaproteobacteria bacterium]